MALAPITSKTVLGMFLEKDYGNHFEYVASDQPNLYNDYSPYEGENFPHEVFVGGAGDSRMARVLKTVAYVIVDEHDDGSPVIEKWDISHDHLGCWRK